jgi:hypothetical protein
VWAAVDREHAPVILHELRLLSGHAQISGAKVLQKKNRISGTKVLEKPGHETLGFEERGVACVCEQVRQHLWHHLQLDA